MGRGKDRKAVKQTLDPRPEKRPKSSEPVIEGLPLAWRFSGCDKTGPFSWTELTPEAKFKEVVEKLHEFETKTWQQIMDTGSHPIPIDQIDKPAREQLERIGQDDIDDLMSFRLAGANRVWCVRSGNIMRVLWWDPEHQVYPTPKDRGDRRKLHNRG